MYILLSIDKKDEVLNTTTSFKFHCMRRCKMFKYIIQRLLISIPTFLGTTVLVFLLASLAPGSPLELLFHNPNADTETMKKVEERLGLDKPIHIQYIKWFSELLQGNMGVSYRTGNSVWNDIAERIAPSLLLTLSSLIFSVAFAIPMGIISAYKPYSAWDYISSGISFVGAAMPNFFAGLVLIYLLSVKLNLFPSGGMYGTSGAKTIFVMMHHMVLPVLVLSIQQVGSLIRQTRASMMEVLQDDYIRTARAKGCLEYRVLIGHGLRNAFIPIITRIGIMLPFLIGGAVVTEQIFAWPGLGSLMVLAINSRDYPTIMGITVFISITVLIGNLGIDLIYGFLDPRICYK